MALSKVPSLITKPRFQAFVVTFDASDTKKSKIQNPINTIVYFTSRIASWLIVTGYLGTNAKQNCCYEYAHLLLLCKHAKEKCCSD